MTNGFPSSVHNPVHSQIPPTCRDWASTLANTLEVKPERPQRWVEENLFWTVIVSQALWWGPVTTSQWVLALILPRIIIPTHSGEIQMLSHKVPFARQSLSQSLECASASHLYWKLISLFLRLCFTPYTTHSLHLFPEEHVHLILKRNKQTKKLFPSWDPLALRHLQL